MRVDSISVNIAALSAGAVGGLFGLILVIGPPLELFGPWSYGSAAAIASGVTGAIAAGVGYWRARTRPDQEWRRSVASPLATASFLGVILVHALLAALATLVAYLVISRGFLGLTLQPFWAILLMGITTGVSAWVVYLSVSQLTTVRMSNLLMAFVGLGTLSSMVTTSDPEWWHLHFSQLGTFGDLSSLLFNGTLVVGGLLVTTFAIYVSNDMKPIVAAGLLQDRNGPRFVAAMFVMMGIMLTCVGLVPVNVSLVIHNLFATGMAVAYTVLLVSGPKVFRGLAPAYFISAWLFLGASVVSVLLFVVGFFNLTALEIIIFALIFGWISVLIRFLASPKHAALGQEPTAP